MKKYLKGVLVAIIIISLVFGFNVYRNNSAVNEFLDMIENVNEDYTVSIWAENLVGEAGKKYTLTSNEILELKENILNTQYKADFSEEIEIGDDKTYYISFSSSKTEFELRFVKGNEYLEPIIWSTNPYIAWFEMENNNVIQIIENILG